jgi:hypothetical protein
VHLASIAAALVSLSGIGIQNADVPRVSVTPRTHGVTGDLSGESLHREGGRGFDDD